MNFLEVMLNATSPQWRASGNPCSRANINAGANVVLNAETLKAEKKEADNQLYVRTLLCDNFKEKIKGGSPTVDEAILLKTQLIL